MSNNRIIDQKVDIDITTVHNFFDNRVNKKLFHRYNLVNYQDDHPELALQRDKAEKAKILPYIKPDSSSRILDIGCGVGRWGDELVQQLSDGIYVGVDYSQNLIDVAKKAALDDNSSNKRKYYVGSFQQIKNVLQTNGETDLFDIIIVNGVMVYINDCDVYNCINSITDLIKPNGRIYIKESVGVDSRYTLKDIYSNELTSNYSAIYRSIKEYRELFTNCFSAYKLVSEGETFAENGLNNRKETTSYYWIYEA